MTYLVDANILSEVTRPLPAPQVVEWLRENERGVVVDPIILGEIHFGILVLAKGKRRARLERWFETGVRRVECLVWDTRTALRWSELLARLRARGKAMPIKDSLIAATALAHGLTVATRNRADFERAGVEVVDPFEVR